MAIEDGLSFSNDGLWLFAILALFGFGGFGGFGNGNRVGEAYATQADIQRAVDLNSIQQGQADLAADIQRTTNDTISAMKDASYNNLSEVRDVQAAIASGFANMQSCCCDTKQTIMENRYLDAQNASAIMANDTANAQKILDAISANRMADMQNQINALQLQVATAGTIRYPSATTYTAGSSCFANGCGCNV